MAPMPAAAAVYAPCLDHLDDVLLEYLEAVDAGRPPDPAEVVAAHPDLADELRAFFDDQVSLDLQVRPIREALCEQPGGPPEGVEQPPQLPEYEGLSYIGGGGMGTVYRARQPRAQRDVAIKVIRARHLAGPSERERFVEEQRSASLEHPNIVRIYEVGVIDGELYFSMEFAAGGSLAGRLVEYLGQQRRVAELVRTVSRAVDFAHQHGVIHRDLKPANILLAADGTPRVADFGLAKRALLSRPGTTEHDGKALPERPVPAVAGTEPDTIAYSRAERQLTDAGVIVGTASYMAPEQARGEIGLTTAVDVYGLGAILYELLTGQAPFRDADRSKILNMVVETPPVPPCKHDPKVNRDLEAICLKCLRKDARQRYPTAAAVADDLDRWLKGYPVRARPVSWPVRRVMWARREKAKSGMFAAVVMLAVMLAMGAAWYVADILRQRNEDQLRLYVRGVALADRRIATGQFDEAKTALEACPDNLRGWDWEYEYRLSLPAQILLGHAQSVCSACWSPDGRRLLTGSSDGTARLWDSATGKQLCSWRHLHQGDVVASFAGEGRLVVTAGFNQTVKVWREGKDEPVCSLTKAGNLVVADRQGRWLAVTGAGEEDAAKPRLGANPGAPLPQGANWLRLYDLATGKLLRPAIKLAAPVVSLAVSPDGRFLALGGYKRQIELRRFPSGELVSLDPPPKELNWNSDMVWTVAFTPDSRHVAACLPRPVMWDLSTGKVAGVFDGTASMHCSHLDFSSDGKRLAGACRDGLVRIWDVDSKRMVAGMRRHEGIILAAAFSPDRQTLAVTYGRDVVIERLSPRTNHALSGHRQKNLKALAFSPDGRWLASLADKGEVILWDAQRRRLFKRLSAPSSPTEHNGLVFCRNAGRTYLLVGGERLVGWTDEGEPLALPKENAPVRCLCLRSGSNTEPAPVAFTDGGKTVTLWNPETTAPAKTLTVDTIGSTSLAFAPDGKSFAVGGNSGIVGLYSVKSGKLIKKPFHGHTSPVTAIAFSPTGRLLATASADRVVLVWEVDADRPPTMLRGHQGGVLGVTFSRDDRRLASCASDGQIKLWDVKSGEELFTLNGHKEGPVTALAFDPAGEVLASCGHDGMVRLWDSKPVRTPRDPEERKQP